MRELKKLYTEHQENNRLRNGKLSIPMESGHKRTSRSLVFTRIHIQALHHAPPRDELIVFYNKSIQPEKGRENNENEQGIPLEIRKPTSMGTLIMWNVTKALEQKPDIDLKSAMKAAQERLDRDPVGATAASSSHCPVERHLACALLAWQRLGHNDVESLHQFICMRRNKENFKGERETLEKDNTIPDSKSCVETKDKRENKDSDNMKDFFNAGISRKCSVGPVVKLPTEAVVMRLDNASNRQTPGARQPPKKIKVPDRDLITKIDAACCLDTDCAQRLSELDTATKEMRTRAARLARREAERVELLERAEAAWKDLEIGYQRRLSLAVEKEEDMQKQIQKMIEERNGFKEACINLAQQLKTKGEAAEKDRKRLTLVEKDVCDRACMRLRLSEEAARGDATLAEYHCRAAQLERDLQFKEEQTRRKLTTLEQELESTRTLTLEAERAMRAELGAIRDQIAHVSDELINEDNDNTKIKLELEELRKEKMEMIEDLEGCKTTCDNRMQGKADELKKKRDQLSELKKKVLECRCKAPVDAVIEVKRTPSLAALCLCTPEDKLLESCSCTSLRTQLLSNMLGDLFGGLQAELGGCGAQMPCQLLKCLEDRHNWDRASIVKTNLRNFFSKLLIGELDIAIATAIEKYHAKWVGASCADEAKLIPDPGEVENEGWQERALERKAQKLAEKLAEELFKERSEQLMQKAKDIVKAGPPPCECKHLGSPNASVTKSEKSPEKGTEKNIEKGAVTIAPMYWQRTQRDVTQLRMQIENLKKESIKKEDLKSMEEKLVKIVQRTSGHDKSKPSSWDHNEDKGEEKNNKNSNYQDTMENNNKPTTFNKKKVVDSNIIVRKGNRSTINQNMAIEKVGRTKRPGQSYAVNVCLCSQKDPKKIIQENQFETMEYPGTKATMKQKSAKEIGSKISSIKQTKPISMQVASIISPDPSCKNNCACFHKVPSNTSIDKLLDTLAKWKCDLTKCLECDENNNSNSPVTNKNSSVKSMSKIKANSILSEIQTNSKLSETPEKSGLNEIQPSSQLSEVQANSQLRDNNSILGNIQPNPSEWDKGLGSQNPIEEDVSKCIGFEHNTPVSKQSEYIAAINLDKSNDNICKCNIGSINKNTYDAQTGDSRFQFKCINSGSCYCKDAPENRSTELRENQNLNTLDPNPNKLPLLSSEKNIKNTKITGSIKNDKIYNLNESGLGSIQAEVNNIVKKELLTCDCDYNIQFLGVTLADTSDDNVLHDTDTNKHSTNKKIDSAIQDEPPKTVNNIPKDSDLNRDKDLIAANTINAQKKNCRTSPACECNLKFDEFKKILNNGFRKQQKTRNIKQDKALDVQSLKGLADKQDCVCCDKVDDSKDLELNAFYLLEEHLKKKLAEFKLSTCKSSCIPPHEEEKIFTAILERVKNVITDSTNKLMCKCPGVDQSLGSWNRAYGLLQEYLKIKIKRVQCLCVSPDTKEEILPDVLDKVCNLIENDFHRLESICTCNEDVAEKNVRFRNKTSFEIPVKDTNNKDENSKHNSKLTHIKNENMISKQNSNSSMVNSQNISSQVPANLGMETKSCDAIKKGTKDMQTSNKDLNTKYDGCDCVYTTTIPKTEPFLELFGTNQVFINRCTDLSKGLVMNSSVDTPDNVLKNDHIMKKLDSNISEVEHLEEKPVDLEKSIFPYIGYTIDCTCDRSLGSCVCTKSVVEANNVKIQSIWKTFTNNTCINDATYIMNGPNKIGYKIEEANMDPIPDNTEKKYKTVCETEVNVSIGEDLVLKQSPKKLPNTSITTNTFDDTSIETDYSNNEDPLDWYECGTSQMQKPQQTTDTEDLTNSLYFPALPNAKKRAQSEIYLDKNALKLPNLLSCDCDAVPICHVKMLVENIENKLINSMCTCDSLAPKVCPVHSKMSDQLI